MSEYDSTLDTQAHIARVGMALLDVLHNLEHRASFHDQSKLAEPEKSAFDILTPKLKDLVYGSAAYRAVLGELQPAIDHHYGANSHHPEHYQAGIRGMSLLDLIEMLCDWKAAGERHEPPTNFGHSIAINTERFQLTPELVAIFFNTARELGWITE